MPRTLIVPAIQELKVYGLRMYKVNERFWKDLTNEKAVYALGMLCSDGGVFSDGKSGQPSAWYISSTDEDIINKVRVACGYEGPITVVSRIGRKKIYKLQVYRKEMAKDLIALGLFHSKVNLRWIGKEVGLHWLNHFCRGLVDGDGCICIKPRDGNNRVRVHYADNSREFVTGVADVWSLVVGRPIKVSPVKGVEAWQICVGGKYARKLLEWLYKDATIYMNRKKALYDLVQQMEWLSQPEALRRAFRRRNVHPF